MDAAICLLQVTVLTHTSCDRGSLCNSSNRMQISGALLTLREKTLDGDAWKMQLDFRFSLKLALSNRPVVTVVTKKLSGWVSKITRSPDFFKMCLRVLIG